MAWPVDTPSIRKKGTNLTLQITYKVKMKGKLNLILGKTYESK